MSRKLLRAAVGLVLAGVLAGCGAGGDQAREDYGFKGVTSTGAPFELTVKTGPVGATQDDQTVTDAHGNKSMELGESEVGDGDSKCADPANHDEAFELTFQVKVPRSETEELDLNLILSVADADRNTLTSETDRSVRIAWLTETRATCQTTVSDIFGRMSVSKEEEYQVKALVVLPGGASHYDSYTLSVRTDAGEIHDLRGGALPLGDGTGVMVDLAA